MTTASTSTNMDEFRESSCNKENRVEELDICCDSNKNQIEPAHESDSNSNKQQTDSNNKSEKLLTANQFDSNEENSEVEILKKLEIIKEIKNKTNDMLKIRNKLIEKIGSIESETKCLQEFQTEFNLLVQEKLEQEEILRQIQDDISKMEITIKKTEEEKEIAIESALRLHYEYKPLKNQINYLKESIGLDKADDNNDINIIDNLLSKFQPFADKHVIKQSNKPINISKNNPNQHDISKNKESKLNLSSPNKQQQQQQNKFVNSSNLNNQTLFSLPIVNQLTKLNHNQLLENEIIDNFKNNLNPNFAFNNHKSSLFPNSNPINGSQGLQMIQNQISQGLVGDNFNKQLNQFLFQNQNKPHSEEKVQQTSQNTQSHQLQPISPAFRQQPPPMKACLSCNQQIHRNAPICPLCKAKSRSRNPKKPKKKTNNDSSSRSPSNSTDQLRSIRAGSRGL